MSSSGLIYAGIVGAWAMYLVPVWLRREEQLNEARKKARYAAAIRTLGRTEQFERKVLAEEEALAATGTDGPVRPPVAKPAPKTVTKTAAPSTPPPAKALPAQPAKRDGAAKPAAAAKPGKPGKSGKSAPSRAVPAALADAVKPADATTTTWRPAGAVPAAASQRRPTVTSRVPQRPETAHRGILLMRRRRVVTTLFALATAGAAVSAVLGIAYIWAMLVPAAMFSFYIVNIRRDERLRAAERYRRRQAQLAAERRRDREQRERERVQAEAAAAALSAEQEQRRQLARERSRQRLRGDGPGTEDFRRAANG